MPPKRKQKKGRRGADPVTDAKLAKLGELLAEFRTQCAAYESHLLATCDEQNEQIRKLYMDKLNSIPPNVRKMTIPQVLAYQEEERSRKTECPKDENTIRNMFERHKATTEKKRTLKKDRKRSISANSSVRPLVINKLQQQAGAFPRISRTLSDPALATPLSRFKRVSNMSVTPKFDPSIPITKMARKPKPNEVLMSLSGSPVRETYIVDDSKPTLSLGHGKILTFDEESNIDKEFVKKLDEPMMKMLKDVKQKLDQILQS